MSTVEAIECLDIIYSTRLHFTSDLASTCRNLKKKEKKSFYSNNIKGTYHFGNSWCERNGDLL